MRDRMMLLTLACVLVVTSAVVARQETIRPLGSVKDLMTAIVIPSSTAVFEAAADAPKTPEKWAELRNQVVAVGEAGNLLMLGTRARNTGEWMQMARAQVDAAAALLKVVDAKDGAALENAGNALYESCESCHAKYMLVTPPQ